MQVVWEFCVNLAIGGIIIPALQHPAITLGVVSSAIVGAMWRA